MRGEWDDDELDLDRYDNIVIGLCDCVGKRKCAIGSCTERCASRCNIGNLNRRLHLSVDRRWQANGAIGVDGYAIALIRAALATNFSVYSDGSVGERVSQRQHLCQSAGAWKCGDANGNSIGKTAGQSQMPDPCDRRALPSDCFEHGINSADTGQCRSSASELGRGIAFRHSSCGVDNEPVFGRLGTFGGVVAREGVAS